MKRKTFKQQSVHQHSVNTPCSLPIKLSYNPTTTKTTTTLEYGVLNLFLNA